jgi:aryl-alcohol dehydrogenase-like predicted oxidoreductase
MRHGRFPGVEKPVSRVAMGTARVEPALWERFVEHGGTCFDAAHHYGKESESTLGALLARRGAREQLVLVGKGAHPPTCAPEFVSPQLDESLERLQTDYVDLYLLHRDDPAVPVEAWAEALAAEVERGRARTIGASNWTTARIEAFNRYAADSGLTPFSLVSNQLSLARMLEPVWDGCLAAEREWHARSQMPLLAWAAQGRGFFAGREEDQEVRRSWLSEPNVERRRRAATLAAWRGLEPVSVALAWVLAQPFPSFAAVGPRSPAELDACLAAVGVELTDEEIGWLDLAG